MKIALPFIPAPVDAEIPDGAFCQLLEPARIPPHEDPLSAIASALDNPIGSAKLEEMASPSSRVAILCDDISRPTPAHLLVPLIIKRLLSAGVRESNIRIVMALGTHRRMSRDDMTRKLGEEVVSRHEVINSLFHGRENLRSFGKSDDGAEILISKAALDADFRIGVGSIMPHPAMGWSGGGKIVYPGVAGEDTVLHFHNIHAMADENFFGMDDAPIRLLVEKWVGLIGLDFVVNTILNADLLLYRVVAGHYVRAQRRGVSHAKDVFEVWTDKAPNIVVADPYPTYHDFGQSCKGYVSADKAFASGDGGTVILVSPMPEGPGPHPETICYIGMDDARAHLAERIARGVLGDDPVGLALNARAAEIRKHRRLFAVTDGVPPELCAKAGMRHYHLRDLAKAVADAMSDYAEPRISVMPRAANTVVRLKGG